jgi:hypothetical protein
MEKDPYILYWRTQSNKEYMVSGYDFGNYVIGEDSKSFDIFFNGEKETIVIYKTRGDR